MGRCTGEGAVGAARGGGNRVGWWVRDGLLGAAWGGGAARGGGAAWSGRQGMVVGRSGGVGRG